VARTTNPAEYNLRRGWLDHSRGEQVAPAIVKKIEGFSQGAQFHVPAPKSLRTSFMGESFVISTESVVDMQDESSVLETKLRVLNKVKP
jgi:hypothetical protein